MLLLVVFNSLLITLLLSLKAFEQEASKLAKLLLKVVWSNDVQDELDLLSFVLVDLDLIVIG